MNTSSNITFADIVGKLLVHKWQIIIIAAVTTAIDVVYVCSLPCGYTATTKIVVERQGGQSISGSTGMLSGFLGSASEGNDRITIDLASSIVQSIPFVLDFENIEIELTRWRN